MVNFDNFEIFGLEVPKMVSSEDNNFLKEYLPMLHSAVNYNFGNARSI